MSGRGGVRTRAAGAARRRATQTPRRPAPSQLGAYGRHGRRFRRSSGALALIAVLTGTLALMAHRIGTVADSADMLGGVPAVVAPAGPAATDAATTDVATASPTTLLGS